MIGIDPLKKVIEATLVSPYIKDEKPVSLLIVAKPEAGKTSAIKLYRENKGICYITDATPFGLTRDILPKLVSGEIKTIMIADLLTPLSKSTKTRKAFVAFLNNLIEEGVAKITTYSMIWEREVKTNVITAITDEELADGRHEWATMGFLSRFLIFSYSYPMDTVSRILEYYSEKPPLFPAEKLNLPGGEVDIGLSKNIADKLDPLAVAMGLRYNVYGIRAKINLRTFIKALAYLNNRTEATDEDLTELLNLSQWLNPDLMPLEARGHD